ncbi:mitogen-activated protein kinase kinase kinase [Friedmanniomyces endolithicus]|nr:mitogen-activated protein kinase kinase kinase [Friedmanniomyces endolithicus]
MERKRKACQDLRKNRNSDALGSRKVVDFDHPRTSPYIVPTRKLPPVSDPTAMLAKANSLTKKTGPNARTSCPSRKEEPWVRMSRDSIPEEEGKKSAMSGSAVDLAGAGKAAAIVGGPSKAPNPSSSLHKSVTAQELNSEVVRAQPKDPARIAFNRTASGRRQSPGAGSPRSPYTLSKGGQQFEILEYVGEDGGHREDDEDTLRAHGRPNLAVRVPSHPLVNKIESDGRGHRPDVSLSSSQNPAQLSRMQSKRGPSFDISSRQVDFASPPGRIEEDDDNESDDGLFSISLANKTKPYSAATPTVSNRPELRLKTSKRNSRFESPQLPPSGSSLYAAVGKDSKLMREEAEDGSDLPPWVIIAERRIGAFRREFRFPVDVDMEKLDARLDAGLLHVVVPKKEHCYPKSSGKVKIVAGE